jgi:hypothetical protein
MSKIKGYTDKEITDRVQVMDFLEANQDELQSLMKLRGMTEEQPGYTAFVMNFVRNKLRDEDLRNEFVTQHCLA